MKTSIHKIIGLIGLHLIFFSFGTTVTLGYSTSRFKWDYPSVTYSVNRILAPSFRTAIVTADNTWDNAGSPFRFHYDGTTDRNPNVWGSHEDGHSDIGHANHGSMGSVIASSSITVEDGTTTIVESDTTFNTYYDFTTAGATGKYDVQNVITHEFGHWLRLMDLDSISIPSFCGLPNESTMCGKIFEGETHKRDLTDDDKDGIKKIYGTSISIIH